MIRYAAAVVVTLCLSVSGLYAQSATFTVNVESASVYKSPSTGAPIIGHALQGAVFPITRNLGSWVKVSWPMADDGVGYLHVSTGTIAHGDSEMKRTPAAVQRPTAASTAPPSAALSQSPAAPDRPSMQQPVSVRPSDVHPLTHEFGLGAMIGGSTFGYGATARAWRRNHLGMQLEFSHNSFTSATAPGRVASTQIEPSLLYALSNRVSDYVWVRPYVGSGATFFQQSLSGLTPSGTSTSDHGFGVKTFGGAEVSFAAMPSFTVSADVGYHWWQTPFAGFDPSGVSLSMSGHWYLR